MIEFMPATEEEKEAYNGQFDCSMFFDSEVLQILQLAARARIISQLKEGQKPYTFDEGVLSFDPRANNMMMNAQYFGLYHGLLASFVTTDYLSVMDDEGLTGETPRERAENLAHELFFAYHFQELSKNTEPDAVDCDVIEVPDPEWSEEDRAFLVANGINVHNLPVPEAPESVALREQCRTVGRFLYNFLKV